jgi:hypothetical protein
MTVGDIKIQALKLMFVTYDRDLTPDSLGELGADINYRAYLINMNGSIDRCLADIEKRCILPAKIQAITPSTEPVAGYMTRCEITARDFFEIERVSKEGLYEYDGDHPYMREGNTILLKEYDPSAKYNLIYYPKARRASVLRDTDELEIPENVAAAIPYFVKGELFREDNASEANESMRQYEAAMASIDNPRTSKQGRVVSTFSQVW